jgi:transcription elongation GreA/GreB family factor
MNKAFVKESDEAPRSSNPLPDRPIPPHPNLVTPEGLAQIEEMIQRLEEGHAAARETKDADVLARTARDLRYWITQRSSAQVVEMPTTSDVVQFGSTVVIARADGEHQTYRIVGVDEANPAQGTLSHISPLARSLMGRSAGESARAGDTTVEIMEIR